MSVSLTHQWNSRYTPCAFLLIQINFIASSAFMEARYVLIVIDCDQMGMVCQGQMAYLIVNILLILPTFGETIWWTSRVISNLLSIGHYNCQQDQL